MKKLLLFPGKTEKGIFTFLLDEEHDHLVKTASEYHPEISNYINSAIPILGKTQILLTALGAGEWWGPNVNGDYFPEKALSHFGKDYGYKTFEYNAKVYRHHINKDPTANYGDVILSVYNPTYHRVELIVGLDNKRAGDTVEKINNGDYPDWSMGVRVPYDICSNCGNRAPTRKQYCECLKYYMRRVHPSTGKMVYAINTIPRFFDISEVLIGADKIAKTLKKVASAERIPALSSAYIAEKLAENKSAELKKKIPAGSPPASEDRVSDLVRSIPEVKAKEPSLPRNVLDSLAARPLPKVMSTMSLMGILPKPKEFQRIVLISVGRKNLADQLDERNMCFDPMIAKDPTPAHSSMLDMKPENFDPEIMNILNPFLPERSYAAPHLTKRISIMIKRAAPDEELPYFIKEADVDRSPLPAWSVLLGAATLYALMTKKAPHLAVGSVDKVIARHPALAVGLAAATPMIFNAVAGEGVKGNVAPMQEPEVSDLLSRIEDQKAKPFLKIGSVLGPASKRLFLGIPAAYMVSGVLQKHREANPYEQEGRIKSFIRKYPDLIGAGLAADAMLALKGKGSTRIIQALSSPGAKLFEKAKTRISSLAEPLMKTSSKEADIKDTLTEVGLNIAEAALTPLAFPGPGRFAAGLLDQAIFAGGKKLLSKDKNVNKIGNTERRV